MGPRSPAVLANDHSAGMLAEVARQVLHGSTELEIFAQAWMIEVESGIVKAAVERVVRILVFPGGNRSGNLVECFGIEAHGFAHFARGHAVAIRDHIGGHRGATLSVKLVDVLDDALALVAAG